MGSDMGHDFAAVSAVLFDVGNTLHHIDHLFIARTITRHARAVDTAAVAVAEYHAKHAIDELFRRAAGGDDTTRQFSYFETILAALDVPVEQRPGILEDLHEENQRSSLWRVMHASTPTVLAELQVRGFTMGVVSNADGRVAAALAEMGTAPYFRAIIDSHVVGVEKPHARIFQLALDACGLQPARTVYVGDIYEIDVNGARAAGLRPILLDPLQLYGDVDCDRIRALDDLLDLLPPTASHDAG